MFDWFKNMKLISKIRLLVYSTFFISILALFSIFIVIEKNDDLIRQQSDVIMKTTAHDDDLQIEINNIVDISNQYNDEVEGLFVIIIVIIVLLIIFLAFVLSKMSRDINKNIDEIISITNDIAKGELGVNTKALTNNEFGIITKNILNSRDEIGNFVNVIDEIIKNTSNGTYFEVDKNNFDGEFFDTVSNIEDLMYNSKTEKEFHKNIFETIRSGKFDSKSLKETGNNTEIISLLKSLEQIQKSILIFSENLSRGDFDFEINTKFYQNNTWGLTLDSLNYMKDSVRKPIDQSLELLVAFEKGDLSYQVESDFEGIFEELIGSLNKTLGNTKNCLGTIIEISEAIAKKDYSIKLDKEKYKGDFNAIYTSFTNIFDDMNMILGTISNNTEDMLTSTLELKNMNDDVSSGIVRQVSSISEVTEVVALTKDGVENSTKVAETTNKSTIVVKSEVENCNSQMKTMLEAMSEINIVSDKISNIIKVINDIAFQTNLLALNASVEAARAGQHGKGFAVVAEEVGNLASRSQGAATETSSLITETIKKVKIGSDTANLTADTLTKIVEYINQVTNNIDGISTELSKQNENVDGLHKNINEVSEIAQNNLRLFEKSNETFEGLDDKINSFKDLYEEFKLRGNNKKSSKMLTKEIKKDTSVPIGLKIKTEPKENIKNQVGLKIKTESKKDEKKIVESNKTSFKPKPVTTTRPTPISTNTNRTLKIKTEPKIIENKTGLKIKTEPKKEIKKEIVQEIKKPVVKPIEKPKPTEKNLKFKTETKSKATSFVSTKKLVPQENKALGSKIAPVLENRNLSQIQRKTIVDTKPNPSLQNKLLKNNDSKPLGKVELIKQRDFENFSKERLMLEREFNKKEMGKY